MKLKASQFVLDVALAAGLGVALLAVVGVDAFFNVLHPSESTGPTVTETTLPSRPPAPLMPTLAVTMPYMGDADKFGVQLPWDDVGKLLDSLGKGYKYDRLEADDLMDVKKLAKYNVVFYSCGDNKNQFDTPLINTLRAYVSQGGTLYASDWRYDIIAAAFPDLKSKSLSDASRDAAVHADVVDPGLLDIFGDKLWLSFDLPNWKTAAFQGERVKVLLKGAYLSSHTGKYKTAPLLVRFNFGRGNVIFTSYHHGKNNSENEKKLLKYLVFSLVTAKEEAGLDEAAKGQYTPIKSNTISFSPGGAGIFDGLKASQKATFSHQQKEAGKLRFDLVFLDQGANLKLTATSPGGKVFEKSGRTSFFVEVPAAEAGNWSYTVTALEVPYDNFAVTVRLSK